MKGEKWGARVGATGQLGLCGSFGLADFSQVTTSDVYCQFTHIKGRGTRMGLKPILPLES